jgi:WD40 repeat protein
MGLSPAIAFSRDSRLIAGAAGDNSVKIWDVYYRTRIQTLASSQGNIASAMTGVFYIGFTADGRVVTISDAIRIWDPASGQELRTISNSALNPTALMGGAGAVLTPDGTSWRLFLLMKHDQRSSFGT